MRIIIGGDLAPTVNNGVFFETGDVNMLVDQGILDLLKNADYTILNLETPLVDNDTPIKKNGPNLRANVGTINGIKKINPHFLCLANNHILDQGWEGLKSTRDTLIDNDIDYCGVGNDIEHMNHSFIKNIQGINVGIYCCTEHEFSIATEELAGANPFDPMNSFDHVEVLKSKCDYLIVLYHGGKEYYRYPSPTLQKIFRKFASVGADLVVAQHSHCVGCYEVYKDATLIYGQGNFLFCLHNNEFWNNGLVIQVDIEKSGFRTLSYHGIIKEEKSIRMASSIEEKEILDGFINRSKEIMDVKNVRERYKKYSKEMMNYYLAACSGRKGFIFRGINKVLGNRLMKKYLRFKYDNEQKLAIQNYIECESHRELLLISLKNSDIN